MIHKIKAFIDVLRESNNPFKMIVGQILVKSGLNRFLTISMNGYKINFSRSALAVTFFADSNDRHEDELVLKRLLKQGGVYVDIGANIGTLVLAASTFVGNSGKVIAVEAHPATFGYLKENVELNKFSNIELINAAAGNKAGSISFSNINSDDQNKVLIQNENGIKVELDTLDNLLSSETAIDLLKIDVEGYEKFVLEGATSTLNKTKIVFYESWEKHFNGFGYYTSDVINIFRENGFTVYKLEADSLLPLSSTYKSVNCENLLAVKDIQLFCATYQFSLKPLN